MWNLSALAQKAKEAAIRLESQLDDSVGIKDESGFSLGGALGIAPKSSSGAGADNAAVGNIGGGADGAVRGADSSTGLGGEVTAAGVDDDFNVDEEDDFFSDSHHERLLTEKQQQFKQEQQNENEHQLKQELDQVYFDEDEDINFEDDDRENDAAFQTEEEEHTKIETAKISTPAAKKMELGVDEGDNFFEDNNFDNKGNDETEIFHQEEEPLKNEDAVQNHDDVNAENDHDLEEGGDGWDEADDIPFDDEEEEQEEEEEEINFGESDLGNEVMMQQPEPVVDLEAPAVEIEKEDTIVVESKENPPSEPLEELPIAKGGEGMTLDNQPSFLEEGETIVSIPLTEDNTDHTESEAGADAIEREPVAIEDATLLASYHEDVASKQDENNEIEVTKPDESNSYAGIQECGTLEQSGIESDSQEITPQNEEPYASTDHHNYESSQLDKVQESIPTPSLPLPTLSPPQQTTPPKLPSMDDEERSQYLHTIAQLQSQLQQREEQLSSKSSQITSLTLQHESESTQLRQIISETKEEAKKRILRAKERVEEMQGKLADAVRRADAAGGDSREQEEIIKALREEGEGLARKQSQMEQAVRSARGEARELKEVLQAEKEEKAGLEKKVEELDKKAKSLKEELNSARKGESLSKKLEGDLVAAKEESEKQRAANLGLEQQLKELREENRTLKKEVEDAKAGAALESERESSKLKKERDDMLSDLENKLRTSEREANVREDALRHEVSELRKRWQDAVRRAEDLNMDVQQSTAPLLRQLESTERQNRTRAAAWAELETKLRSDLEEHVIQLEKITKERNDLRASDKRLNRLLKEKEEQVVSSQETIDALSATIENLETRIEELEEEGKRMKEEWVQVERQASEGLTKARNDIMKSMVDSEERYRSQIAGLEDELKLEREKRAKLEKQLDSLAESVKAAEFIQSSSSNTENGDTKEEKKLRATTNQASILHDTLIGLDSDVDDEGDDEDDDELNPTQGYGSFAAMEQLSLGLKGAKLELEALRKQLASSEETRESLLAELGETRQAAEKLTLFEEKVSELTMESKLKDMEIKGLQDDIADVKLLYRSQLDALLEEKMLVPKDPVNPPLGDGERDENDGWDDF